MPLDQVPGLCKREQTVFSLCLFVFRGNFFFPFCSVAEPNSQAAFVMMRLGVRRLSTTTGGVKPGNKWKSRALFAGGLGIGLYLGDTYFYDCTFQRNIRTLWNGVRNWPLSFLSHLFEVDYHH
jgi:hypothetical protein